MLELTTESFETTSYTNFTLNDTFSDHIDHNVTSSGCNYVRPSRMFGLIVKVVYAIGIVGNAVAIIALRRGERRVRNRKHLLLLTSLAANDLVALVSVFI